MLFNCKQESAHPYKINAKSGNSSP